MPVMAIKEATVLLLLLVLVLLFERSPQPLYDENITGEVLYEIFGLALKLYQECHGAH